MRFVDANVFHYYIFKSKYTDQIATLFKKYHDLATSIGVLDEVMFVIIRRLAERRLGIRKIDKLRSYIRAKGLDFAVDKLAEFVELIEGLGIVVLQDHADPKDLFETMTEYNLPPSDAIIALTCKHYGINTILTFDKDIKDIP